VFGWTLESSRSLVSKMTVYETPQFKWLESYHAWWEFDEV
jgi:hypothetical protein